MNQILAMRTFIRVVQKSSFSAVALEHNTSQATVSKRVAALEEHLGVKLLTRSSRSQSLTEAGKAYYQRCQLILEALDEAEAIARCQSAAPRGRLRITAPVDFTRTILSPLFQDFLSLYPDISLDLVLDNQVLNLVTEGIDIAIRSEHMPDSSMIAKPLCQSHFYLVASPDYLQKNASPIAPEDLTRHNCIIYSHLHTQNTWQFLNQSKNVAVPVSGNIRCDNGDVIVQAAVVGIGLAMVPSWLAYKQLQAGTLIELLSEFSAEPVTISAVYPERKHLPLKVRTFINFLSEHLADHPALIERAK